MGRGGGFGGESPLLDLGSNKALQNRGRVRGSREAGFARYLSPFLRCFNPLKLLYRAGHLLGALGFPKLYIKAHIHILGIGFLRASFAIRKFERETSSCCSRRVLCCSQGGRTCPHTSTRSGKHCRRIRG